MLIAAGVNAKAVQYFMAWEDSRMVDRYAHPVAEIVNETAQAMERALSLPKDRKKSAQAGWKKRHHPNKAAQILGSVCIKAPASQLSSKPLSAAVLHGP